MHLQQKKIRVIASTICLLKNPDAFVWQEAVAVLFQPVTGGATISFQLDRLLQ